MKRRVTLFAPDALKPVLRVFIQPIAYATHKSNMKPVLYKPMQALPSYLNPDWKQRQS